LFEEDEEHLVEKILKMTSGIGIFPGFEDNEKHRSEKDKLMKMDIYTLKDMERKYFYSFDED